MPIYMRIEGLEGDSQSDHYRGWFECFSFSWGETQTSGGTGGGGGAGKVSFSDLSIMKSTGKSSPKLFLFCASGKHLPAVQLEVTKVTHEREERYLKYELKDVLISSYQTSGDGGSAPVESLSLNFTRFDYTQFIQLPNGQTEQESAFWDIKKNQGG